MRAKSPLLCDVPGSVGRYLRAASESVFRKSGRYGMGNRAVTGQRMEQGSELVVIYFCRSSSAVASPSRPPCKQRRCEDGAWCSSIRASASGHSCRGCRMARAVAIQLEVSSVLQRAVHLAPGDLAWGQQADPCLIYEAGMLRVRAGCCRRSPRPRHCRCPRH